MNNIKFYFKLLKVKLKECRHVCAKCEYKDICWNAIKKGENING